MRIAVRHGERDRVAIRHHLGPLDARPGQILVVNALARRAEGGREVADRGDRHAAERSLACHEHAGSGNRRVRTRPRVCPKLVRTVERKCALAHLHGHGVRVVRNRERARARLHDLRHRGLGARHGPEPAPRRHVDGHSVRAHHEVRDARPRATEPFRDRARRVRHERGVVEAHALGADTSSAIVGRRRLVELEHAAADDVERHVGRHAHLMRRRRTAPGNDGGRVVQHVPSLTRLAHPRVREQGSVRQRDHGRAGRLRLIDLRADRHLAAVQLNPRTAVVSGANSHRVAHAQTAYRKRTAVRHAHDGRRVIRGLARAAADRAPAAVRGHGRVVRYVKQGVCLLPIAHPWQHSEVERLAGSVQAQRALGDREARVAAVRGNARRFVPVRILVGEETLLLAEQAPVAAREPRIFLAEPSASRQFQRAGTDLDETPVVGLRRRAVDGQRRVRVGDVHGQFGVARHRERHVAGPRVVAARPLQHAAPEDELAVFGRRVELRRRRGREQAVRIGDGKRVSTRACGQQSGPSCDFRHDGPPQGK